MFVEATRYRALQDELEQARRDLETAYEELQSTNEELETIDDELRQRTDEALRTSSFISSILSSIPQGAIAVGRQLEVTAWSHTSSEIWGLREDEVRGQHFLNLDIGLPVGALRDPIRTTLAGEPHEPVTLPALNRRGQPITCTVSFAQLHSHEGVVAGAILVVTASRDGEQPPQ